MKRAFALILVFTLALVVATGQNRQAPTEAEKAISTKLATLRSLDDMERARVTKDLALQIRKLPDGQGKLGLSLSLATVATEGDFGRDTLQEVATTLVGAIKAQEGKGDAQMLEFGYQTAAMYARYEHMRVDLSSAGYKAAMKKLEEDDVARSKADFTLKDLSGKPWTLSSLKGKVVLVNFWATWCPPCRKELPDIQALYNRFKDQGFVVLAISDEESKVVEPFVQKAAYSFPVLLDPGRKVNTLFNVQGIPKNFVYDRSGKIVAQSIDMRTQKQFLEMLGKAGLK